MNEFNIFSFSSRFFLNHHWRHSQMDAYSYKPSKGLKFKGDNAQNKKKKKSKSATTSKEDIVGSTSTTSPPPISTPGLVDTRTESEKKFDKVQRQRLKYKVKDEAKLSHKEKVDQFNKKLDSLTEHNDLPKIGPG